MRGRGPSSHLWRGLALKTVRYNFVPPMAHPADLFFFVPSSRAVPPTLLLPVRSVVYLVIAASTVYRTELTPHTLRVVLAINRFAFWGPIHAIVHVI